MGHAPAKTWRSAACLGLLLAALLPITVLGDTNTSTAKRVPEYHLKTAFLYNFAKFVRWPERSFATENTPFVLGVLNASELESSLRLIRGRKIKGHPIIIKTCHSPRDVRDCHMVFLNSSDALQVKNFIRQALGSPVLTVGDIPEFIDMGGIVRFYPENRKLRFEISSKTAKANGLRVSAHLLEVSRAHAHGRKGEKR